MWEKGKSANPGGRRRDKKFLEALERAIVQDDGKRLRQAAEKLLDLAAGGEGWAIQQLADRLDGKPTQQVDMSISQAAIDLSDSELSRIAAGSSAGTPEAPGGPSKPTSVH